VIAVDIPHHVTQRGMRGALSWTATPSVRFISV